MTAHLAASAPRPHPPVGRRATALAQSPGRDPATHQALDKRQLLR